MKPISAFYHYDIACRASKFKPKTLLDIGGAQKLKTFLPDVRIVDANKTQGIDGTKLPYRDKQFDVTVSVVTLEHVGEREDQFRFLLEAFRVSKLASIHLFPLGNAARSIEEFKKSIGHPHPCVILNKQDFITFLETREIFFTIDPVDNCREHLMKLFCTFPHLLNSNGLNYIQNLGYSDYYAFALEMHKWPLDSQELS